jgi:hypothetical protein
VLLGEKNLSHLRRCGILAGALAQRLRTGLICGAPPALGGEELGDGPAFLARKPEGKPKRPLARRAGLKASATLKNAETARQRPFGHAQNRPFGYAQGRRAGLKCGAPPAVRGEDLGNGSAFLD